MHPPVGQRLEYEIDGYDPDEPTPAPRAAAAQGVPSARGLTLDAAGTARVADRQAPAPTERPASLAVEIEFHDPNGEVLTAATRVALWPARVCVGLRARRRGRRRRTSSRSTVIVVDLAGKPVAQVAACASRFSSARPTRTASASWVASTPTIRAPRSKTARRALPRRDRRHGASCPARASRPPGAARAPGARPADDAGRAVAAQPARSGSRASERVVVRPCRRRSHRRLAREASATSRARRRASRCACRSARRPRW